MRTFAVIEQTVSTLKGAGYRAELHALAIPRPESLLGIFARYARDMTLTGQGRFSAIAIHDQAYNNIPVNLQRAARELPIDRLAVYGRNLANETVVCLDTDGLADLTTIDFNDLFAQVRKPQRDADFYRNEYEQLRQSARQRGETNATYLTQLTTLADLLT